MYKRYINPIIINIIITKTIKKRALFSRPRPRFAKVSESSMSN